MSAVYSLIPLAWALLRQTDVRRDWLFESIDIFGGWYYLCLPLLLLLTVAMAHRRAAVWLCIPLLTFTIEYGALFTPDLSIKPDRGVRFVTINVSSGNQDAPTLAAVLASQQPDVVAVQELGVSMARQLAGRAAEQYPYQALYPSRSADGMGLLSRHPIATLKAPEMGEGSCFCQEVTIALNGGPVTVINVHLPVPRIAHTRILSQPVNGFGDTSQEPAQSVLLERVASSQGPLVVLGDFNTADRQPFYRLLRDRLQDAHRSAGWGFGYTYPSHLVVRWLSLPLALVRIDYVLYDQGWEAHSTQTARLRGSDHLYVVADLALRVERSGASHPSSAVTGPGYSTGASDSARADFLSKRLRE